MRRCGYVQLALAADELWVGLEHDTGDKLLYRTGGLDLGREGFEELTLVQQALKGSRTAPSKPFHLPR